MDRTALSRLRPGLLAVAAAIMLAHQGAPAGAQIRAQTSPPADAPPADSQQEISVAPNARDAQIAGRLTRILDASEWFDDPAVSVREGIVFLDGRTGTEERRDWARQLALRTEDVVAVVNRIDVEPEISWDLAPTLREIERLTNQVRWIAPVMVVSVVILVIAWLLSRGVAALARRAFRKRVPSQLLLNLLSLSLSIPVFLIGLYLVLQVAGLTRLALTVLGGTGLVGVVIGLAFREIAENSLASILLCVRNPFRAGDWIRVGDHQGIVQSLDMRATVLLTLDGNHIQIPNSLVFKSVITNFSSNPGRRGEFVVGIGYDDSIVEAQAVVIRALRGHPAVLDDPEPGALVDDLGPSTVNIRVQFWFDGHAYSIFKVRSALMRQVKRALQDAGISMPDAAREVVFPDGVPIRRAAAGGRAVEREPQPSAEAPAGDEAATVATGEGDLGSDEDELKRQAAAAELPGAGENLLVTGDGERRST